ncbi:MAG TPA: DNA-binding transcriptional regulator [Planctomycetota bacterium]|nr:DNA-binding transcriptional regulator [Planctomycetota bacterium]
MQKQRRVALLIETSNAYGRGLLRGVVAYVREHRPWSIYFAEQGRGDPPPRWLASWDGDGVIARIENRRIARAIVESKLPTVDISAARLVPALPWVETNDAAIAKMAADHLFERGFRRFGFCGDARFNWSTWRTQHFIDAVRARNCECSVFQPQAGKLARPTEVQIAAIGAWLRALPKPAGVMACYDIRAQQVLAACRDAELAVPEEVAVVGVDNDELLCDLCSPPLSSVLPNHQKAGYEAARLLERMMSGQRVPPVPHLIEPLRLEIRQSSDVLAVHDADVAKAMHLIRQHACDGMDVSDVLRAVPVSRRVLESRFKRLLGVTPHEEILRVKLERVKRLLLDTQLSLSEIARRTGFEHVEYLSVAFKRETGATPRRYRNEARH